MIKLLLTAVLLLLSPLSFSKEITAASWAVVNVEGDIVSSENIYEKRSIASITKLMTVMVVLDARQDLEEYIKPYSRKELIQLAIVHSDNRASEDLCKHYPTGRSDCIKAMNAKAKYLGMIDTHFVDPTGLGVMNVSTAYDLIKLVSAAQNYSEIVEASKMSKVVIKQKRRTVVFNNTNPIIGKRYDFIVSKTGFIRASGGCIVMMLDTELGRRTVVLLGSKNTKTRIPEAEKLALR